MLKPKQRGLASCPPDYLKHQISRLRLNTTAFPSRYLGRHTRRTATSRISRNCPSKTNIRRPRRSCAMPRGPKGNLAVLSQSRHFDRAPATSALSPINRHLQSRLRCLKGAHEETHAPQQTITLFYHLVGAGEHDRRHLEAERLGGLEVEHRLVFGRRLHRQVSRLLALEDAIDIAGRLPVSVDVVSPVGPPEAFMGLLAGIHVHPGNAQLVSHDEGSSRAGPSQTGRRIETGRLTHIRPLTTRCL